MHIGVAGNIGCGKTTLTRMLSEHYGWTPKFEAVSYNPYLEDYYKDIPRWSFNLEVYFLEQRFKDVLGETKAPTANPDSTTIVTLTSYEANELKYDVLSRNGGVLVFSEIYYPGWTCTVDGNPVEIGRVNYVLRAIRVEGGEHKVVFTFKPKSERVTETIAYSALGLLALLFVGLLVRAAIAGRRKKD